MINYSFFYSVYDKQNGHFHYSDFVIHEISQPINEKLLKNICNDITNEIILKHRTKNIIPFDVQVAITGYQQINIGK